MSMLKSFTCFSEVFQEFMRTQKPPEIWRSLEMLPILNVVEFRGSTDFIYECHKHHSAFPALCVHCCDPR